MALRRTRQKHFKKLILIQLDRAQGLTYGNTPNNGGPVWD
ncbi:uncharacterized protein METZ01_LOCUS182349 [marine metagenome]|uniref:Uncharacterized protein n=1 Tax=marine metagenome TaxID=408172 RepID=A0A382CTS8_9ZZZZ